MTATTTRAGMPPSLDDIGLEGPRRKSRLPEVALGLVIVAVCGLASLWWYSTAAERTDVLALREPITQGDTLEVEDLIKVAIATEDPVATMSEAEVLSIVGQVAVTDLSAGTLVTPAMFAQFNPMLDGSVVVGLDLEIGRVPAVTPLPGDAVAVVLLPVANATEPVGEIMVESAVVVETAAIGTQGRRFLALSMTEEDATEVTSAASQNRIALIRVPGAGN